MPKKRQSDASYDIKAPLNSQPYNMTDFTIYHNPRCSKSRQTLQLLEEKGVSISIVKYLETPPSAEVLADVVSKLGVAAKDIVRTKEAVYKELGLHERTPSDAEWFEILAETPKLIERPIVVKGDKAVIGRPPENVASLFE